MPRQQGSSTRLVRVSGERILELRARDLTAVSSRPEALRFTGIDFNDATAAELAREIRQAGAYLNRVTRALQNKLNQ